MASNMQTITVATQIMTPTLLAMFPQIVNKKYTYIVIAEVLGYHRIKNHMALFMLVIITSIDV